MNPASLHFRIKLPALGLLAAALMQMPFASAQDAAPRQLIADFFKKPVFTSPALSPDGKRLAMVSYRDGKRGQLLVFELAKPGEGRLIAGFERMDVSGIQWVNKDRLLYSSANGVRGVYGGMAPGLWAINADGTNGRALISSTESDSRLNFSGRMLGWEWGLHSTLSDGSADVLVQKFKVTSDGDLDDSTLVRVNTNTGERRSALSQRPAEVRGWFTDGRGKPVAAISRNKSSSTLHLAQPDGSWTRAFETQAWTESVPVPLAQDAEGRLWMIGADTERKTDASVLLRYDPREPGKAPKVLMGLKGYDFNGTPIIEHESRELLGVSYESDGPGTHWFNERMKAIQADIDAQLPSTSNRIHCALCLNAENLIVSASSDRQPDVLMRYEVATKRLQALATSRPWIEAARMGEVEPVIIKTRDGMSMPVTITFPPGPRKPAPAVVLVHGGPYVRGNYWRWDADAQFLASRGYVVIEPEFRGSTGYGRAHFTAGFKQWGLKMQDDIADAGDWAAKQGYVDPKRVCIAGASYGGYAAMMGLVRYEDRYRCAINWVGVTDIDLLFTAHWSDTSGEFKTYGMPVMIGDRKTDAERFRETSPVSQAARITRPVLMAYGAEDLRVPLDHGTAMRDALTKAGNKDVEWVVYPDEGHGWRQLGNTLDFWTRVEKFLDRHIGSGSQATK